MKLNMKVVAVVLLSMSGAASAADLNSYTASDLKNNFATAKIAVPTVPEADVVENAAFSSMKYSGQIQTFVSGRFIWMEEADKSMNNAVAMLKKAGIVVLGAHRDSNTYTIVFQASRGSIETYDSDEYHYSSDARKAAAESAALLESQGLVVLEENLNERSFSISYLDLRHPHGHFNQMLTLTFATSGKFTQEKAKESMERAVAMLRENNFTTLLEAHLEYTGYTLVFRTLHGKIDTYVGEGYSSASDTQKAADEFAIALESQGVIILEKSVTQRSFSIAYFNLWGESSRSGQIYGAKGQDNSMRLHNNYRTDCRIIDGSAKGYVRNRGGNIRIAGNTKFVFFDSDGGQITYSLRYVSAVIGNTPMRLLAEHSAPSNVAFCEFDISEAI